MIKLKVHPLLRLKFLTLNRNTFGKQLRAFKCDVSIIPPCKVKLPNCSSNCEAWRISIPPVSRLLRALVSSLVQKRMVTSSVSTHLRSHDLKVEHFVLKDTLKFCVPWPLLRPIQPQPDAPNSRHSSEPVTRLTFLMPQPHTL